jgi:hypothetical protein
VDAALSMWLRMDRQIDGYLVHFKRISESIIAGAGGIHKIAREMQIKSDHGGRCGIAAGISLACHFLTIKRHEIQHLTQHSHIASFSRFGYQLITNSSQRQETSNKTFRTATSNYPRFIHPTASTPSPKSD